VTKEQDIANDKWWPNVYLRQMHPGQLFPKVFYEQFKPAPRTDTPGARAHQGQAVSGRAWAGEAGMNKKELLKAVRDCKERIAKERDELRILIEDAETIEQSCEEAIESLEYAADSLSEYL
jgi:hypothetical protein